MSDFVWSSFAVVTVRPEVRVFFCPATPVREGSRKSRPHHHHLTMPPARTSACKTKAANCSSRPPKEPHKSHSWAENHFGKETSTDLIPHRSNQLQVRQRRRRRRNLLVTFCQPTLLVTTIFLRSPDTECGVLGKHIQLCEGTAEAESSCSYQAKGGHSTVCLKRLHCSENDWRSWSSVHCSKAQTGS